MFKIIGADGKEYGPVTAEQLRQWIAENRANAQTPVQAEGAARWQRLGELPEFAGALADRGAGAPPPPLEAAPDPEALAMRARASGRTVDLAACLGRSWQLFKANFLLFIGASLLVILASLVTALAAGLIPFLGGLLAWAMAGVLEAGLYWLILKRARGEPAELTDAFGGFRRSFLDLALAAVLVQLLSLIGFVFCVLPWIYLSVAWKLTLPLIIDKRLAFWPGMEVSRRVVTRHWWSLFALVLVTIVLKLVVPVLFGLGALVLAGAALSPIVGSLITAMGLPAAWISLVGSLVVFCLGYAVGWLFSAPLLTPFVCGAIVYAYEDLFGGGSNQAA